jgi:hypothetical protein
MTIEGKVAELINTRELAINIGKNAGVQKGMKFKVLAAKPMKITDPETGEELGEIDREKVRVEVTEVQDSFSICQTYRKRYSGYQIIPRSFMDAFTTPQVKTETLKAEDSEFPPDLSEEESYVKRGDRVIQVSDGSQ